MGPIGYRASAELRRGWRSALVVLLLVAIAGGAVLTIVAGARRSSTAYERFREETLASHLDVAFEGPVDDLDAATAAMRAVPGVEALGRRDYPFVVPAGSGAYPYLDFLAAVPADDVVGRDVDRPRLLQGRDPASSVEIGISEIYAEESGLGVGDRVDFESFAPDQMERLFSSGDAGPPAGPEFTFEVTAVYGAPTFLSESSGAFVPRAFLSPAFGREHASDVATYVGGYAIRLASSGQTAAVAERLRTLFDGTTLEITPSTEGDRKIDASTDVIVTALWLCAAVAALAGVVAVGQALSRHFASDAPDDPCLDALGLTRRQRVGARVLAAVPIAVLGGAGAAVVAVLASPLMPIGVARRAEPDPGVSFDWPVLGAGAVATVALVVLLALVGARVNTGRRPTAPAVSAVDHPARPMRALARTALPVPAIAGIGMVLQPGRRMAVAVRSAVVGVVLGVSGLAGVAVFVASTDALVSSPDRYGAPYDAAVSGFTGDALADGGDDVLADPRLARAALGYSGLGRLAGEELNTHAVEPVKGDLALTMRSGRRPEAPSEVVLGRTSLAEAGAHVGDVIELDGAAGTLRATVVGTAVFPVIDERSSPGRGALLHRDDLERISAPDELNADLLVDWADGVDVPAANARLEERTGTEVFPQRLPSEVGNLRDVDAIPRALGAFLAALAVLAVVHALVSTVRARRHDLAVLRVLGFTRRQLGSTLAWQAVAVALVGIAAGMPLGLLLGRAVWHLVADDLGVVREPATPAVALGLVAVGTLLVVGVVAVLPSRSARSAAASALRAG